MFRLYGRKVGSQDILGKSFNKEEIGECNYPSLIV